MTVAAAGGAAGGSTGGEAGGAASGGAGAAGSAGAAGNAGAASGAAASGAAADWTGGLSEDTRGYVQNKGWKAPGEVLDSYRNLEKLVGTPADQILKLPTKDDDTEGWNKVFSKLGRPEKADDYKFTMPKEGGDENFAKWAKSSFHELGLSQKQGEKLVSKWNEFASGTKQQSDQVHQQKVEQEGIALKSEWGAAYDQNINVARRAVNSLGIDGEVINKLESSMGFAGVMKLMQSLGSKLGEDAFVSGGSRGNGGFNVMTPEAARSRLGALKQDKSFVSRYTTGDVGAKDEMTHLLRMAYPEN